jgi:uncharacterized membrane protein YkvA (DUF1232 family)
MTAPGLDRRERLRLLRERRARRARSQKANRAVVVGAIRQIPAFARLMIGLARDKRVAIVDKLILVGALAYLFMPADFLPDVVPFLGMVDDTFLIVSAVRRLIRNAGLGVVMKYWRGNPADLRGVRIERIIRAAASFLPARMRR